MDYAFWNGCGIGFVIAAPVGPIGVLCIRQSLANGARTGFFSGLGAAAADGFYGAVAAFGLTVISGFLREYATILRLVGGMFLLYLGVTTFVSRPGTKSVTPISDAGAFVSTFFLTLTNPMTIFSFMAIFAGVGFATMANGFGSAALITLGVFSGSALWWLLLSHGAALLRSRITPDGMRWINRASGLVILAFGLAVVWSLR